MYELSPSLPEIEIARSDLSGISGLVVGNALCLAHKWQLLYRPRNVPMMMIGSSPMSFRSLHSRLPQPGDEPKVRAETGDPVTLKMEVIENKRKKTRQNL